MINKNYYTPSNLSKVYFDGKISHYMRRDSTVVLKSYEYVVEEGDDMYKLADKVFGNASTHLWTILAELNPLRQPDELIKGETILLPEIILNDPQIRDFTDEQTGTSLTTVIQY